MNRIFLICLLLVIGIGCRRDMYDQQKYRPLQSSEAFADGGSSRPLIQGTVPRNVDELNATQTQNFPSPVTLQMMQRGQERYNIFCTPCHDYVGTGTGMIVQRGFRQPPSFHTERLRQSPASHFYDVITNGFGAMPSYADKVAPSDRWAIIAYIRALQFSQNVSVASLSEKDKAELNRTNAESKK